MKPYNERKWKRQPLKFDPATWSSLNRRWEMVGESCKRMETGILDDAETTLCRRDSIIHEHWLPTLGYVEHFAYKCWSKVCHVHVVLSTLYQEKMLTKQEIEELKPPVRPWVGLVVIQCTKPPDVVKRTAELLAEVGRGERGKQLKGQWVCSVCYCLSVVMWNLQWTIGINRNFIL